MALTDLTLVAKAIHCPEAAVTSDWPLILQCLQALILGDELTQVAVLATVAVETAYEFKPIKEKGGSAYLMSKPYFPYYGRGYIQITWKYNYAAYGKALGIDLVGDPDLALDPNVAASITAAFVRDKKIALAASAQNWQKVRKLVNGGLNGWDEFKGCVDRLMLLR